MSRIYTQQKRPAAKSAAPSYEAPVSHTPSLASGAGNPELDSLMQAKFQQHFLDNQIPTAEAEADRIAASVSGARTPDEVKSQLGEKMGADFSNVTFHTDSAALKRADTMGARAYTTGSDVYFGSGGFDPGVAAHELVHTVQQGVVGSSMQTVSAPTGGVQMKPKWFQKFFGKKSEPEPSKESGSSNKQKIARNILQSIINENETGRIDFYNKAMAGYLDALELQQKYQTSKSETVPSIYSQNKKISLQEFNAEVEDAKNALAYAIDRLNYGPRPGAKNVDLSGLDEDLMLRNALHAGELANDFQGLDIRSIYAEDSMRDMGPMQDEVSMDSSTGQKDIRINKALWAPGKEQTDSDEDWSAASERTDSDANNSAASERTDSDEDWSAASERKDSNANDSTASKRKDSKANYSTAGKDFTLTHEFGHIVNYHLADSINQENENRLSSDDVSQALLADALSAQSKHDRKLRKILYQQTRLEKGTDLSDQTSLRAIANALNKTTDPITGESQQSPLLKALADAKYTSTYGSVDSGEMYAEAFASHYDRVDQSRSNSQRAKKTPYASLSSRIVNQSKDIPHDQHDRIDQNRSNGQRAKKTPYASLSSRIVNQSKDIPHDQYDRIDQNRSNGRRAKKTRYASLSSRIVNQSKDIFHDQNKRKAFYNRYWSGKQ